MMITLQPEFTEYKNLYINSFTVENLNFLERKKLIH